jgi:hypothetical protein
MQQLLRYNRTLGRLMAVFQWAGPLRGSLQEVFLYMMTRKWVRDKINSLFS